MDDQLIKADLVRAARNTAESARNRLGQTGETSNMSVAMGWDDFADALEAQDQEKEKGS